MVDSAGRKYIVLEGEEVERAKYASLDAAQAMAQDSVKTTGNTHYVAELISAFTVEKTVKKTNVPE